MLRLLRARHALTWHGCVLRAATCTRTGCENKGVFSAFRTMWHRLAFVCALMAGLALTGCRSTPPPKPLDQLTPEEQAGHAVFREHCSLCHYDRVDKPLNGPSLLGMYKKPYLPSGAPANDERVTNTIVHGRNNMPAQGGRLTQEDLGQLLAYLHTL